MFRDKPSAYERMTDRIGEIADRLAELEAQVVERVHPRPSRAERLRRSLEHELSRLSGVHRSRPSSWHLPAVLGGFSLPTASDARSSLTRATHSLREGALDVREHLPNWNSSRWPRLVPSRYSAFRKGMDVQRGVDYLRARPNLSAVLIAGGAVVAVGAAFYITKKVADHAEEPEYETVRSDGDIEIRDYDAMVVAETIKSGYHEKARRRGFETLHDFLRANNRSGKKIAMTVPVLQQLSEGEGRTKGWAVRFIMPKKYTKASLPTPSSDEVTIHEVPARRMVAVRFNGVFNASLASKKLMSIYNYIADEGLKQKGDPIYAFYSPPWTPGFMRRNEILLEIER